MVDDEVIFKGSPASFESTVLLYDARLLMRQAPRLNVSRYAFYVARSAIEPIRQKAPYVVGKGRAAPQLLANPGQWCKIEIAPPSYTTSPDAGITAQLMPGERSLVVLWCEPGAWPDVEPIWRDLLGELARLGLLESLAAPEPVAQKPKRGGRRHRFTSAERREICEEYLALGGGMTQDEFMQERYGMRERVLRNWLREFGL